MRKHLNRVVGRFVNWKRRYQHSGAVRLTQTGDTRVASNGTDVRITH